MNTNTIPFQKVSIIVPCLNEGQFIEMVLLDILNQDYPLENMEIFFIDGGSKDQTISTIKRYQKKHSQIQLLYNSGRFISQALNLGIQHASGDAIIRLDAHSSYPPEYIPLLLEWLYETDANNVGGSWHIRSTKSTMISQSISHILGHPFALGLTSYREGFLDYEEEVDSVPYGCFSKETFEKYGVFNELLERNQDIEFNNRIIKGGGKILLVPDAYCIYYCKDTYLDLWKINYSNGKWAILTGWITKEKDFISKRHSIPMFFLLYFVIACIVSLIIPFTPIVLYVFFPALIYLMLIARASVSISLDKNKLQWLPFIILAFLTLHISYSAGTLAGTWIRLTKKAPKVETA